MLGEFRNQFEALLYSKPLEYVDAMPLVLRFVEGMNDEAEGKFRLHCNNYIRELKKNGFVVRNPEGEVAMMSRLGGQPRRTSPVWVKSTDKFIQYYEAKNRPVGLHSTYNYNTTYGNNSPIAGGDVHQSSSDRINLHSNIPTNIPANTLTAIIWKSLSKITSWILNNIVVVIITGLITAYLVWRLGWS